MIMKIGGPKLVLSCTVVPVIKNCHYSLQLSVDGSSHSEVTSKI